MSYLIKLVAIILLSGVTLSATAQTVDWIDWPAKCQADYDRFVAGLEPIGPPISEPERIDPLTAIELEARDIEAAVEACNMVADADRAACRDGLDDRLKRNQDALEEARLLAQSETISVAAAPTDKRRIEGMAGPLSPRARKAREEARFIREFNIERWQAAAEQKEICLLYPPVPAIDGECPEYFSPDWSGDFEDADGNMIPPDLCFEPRPYDAPPAMSVMTTSLVPQFGPMRPIRVAFKGGTPSIRKAIQKIAMEWAEATNGPVGYSANGTPLYDAYRLEQPLRFDFGKSTPQGFVFNTWTHNDRDFAAEVRISFEDGLGYWSLIGSESTNPEIAHPGEASMNLEGMHGYSKLPADWKAIVFHEFGHALGLQHEHQHPISECGSALRLEDDPGYLLTLDRGDAAVRDSAGRRPGVLTLLEHAPNFWSREEAQFNLGQLKNSGDLDTTPFDPDSIMRYEFDAEWYRDDAPSECLPNGKTVSQPSKIDYAMVAKTYRRIMPRWRP